jgi:uncharacterized protein (DUF2141 family)
MQEIHRTIALALVLYIAAPLLLRGQAAPENWIRVEIAGWRNDKGQVLCALFSSAADFPRKGDKAVAHAKSGISQGRAVCDFQNIAPGTYAVSAFHDENSNSKTDSNFLGMPREGVGASNDANPSSSRNGLETT